MKKNITINLCGRLFQIDEDAYELLQQYIESLRSYFGRQEGGDEIVDDIEARIAELFDELRQQGIEAITIDHVKDIISRIGKPEQMAGEDDGGHQSSESKDGPKEGHRYDSVHSAAQDIYNNVRERTAGKKLFRNPKDKMVAGVLSGFATYTNTDPVIWRLLTVLLVLFYGIGFIAYIVLAIVVPEAKTPDQLLQMEGKDVTPQNLADVVVEDKQPAQTNRGCLGMVFSVLFSVFAIFFVAIASIVGLALLVSLLLIIVSLVIVFTVPSASRISLPFDIEYLNLGELINIHPWVVITFIIGLLLALCIPLYAIGHMLFSRAGKVQPMGVGQRILWIVLWVASLCSLFPALVWIQQQEADHFKSEMMDTYSYQGVMMSSQDKRFLRKGGWDLIKAENCDHYTYRGYYNGNHNVRFLDTYNEDCLEVFQAEHKEAVEPGVYRLACSVRAEGPGTFVYAVGDSTILKPIPAHESQDNVPDMGWSAISIDSIVVTGDLIAYGLSSDEAFTGQPCRAQWFSATDFVLTRIGDLPKK